MAFGILLLLLWRLRVDGIGMEPRPKLQDLPLDGVPAAHTVSQLQSLEYWSDSKRLRGCRAQRAHLKML